MSVNRKSVSQHLWEPSPSCREAEEDDIAYAADIAAFYSKARTEGKVPVVMASVADLRKPKGTPPGKVHAGHRHVPISM